MLKVKIGHGYHLLMISNFECQFYSDSLTHTVILPVQGTGHGTNEGSEVVPYQGVSS